ncbi:hypothetical protein RFI_21029 [Reticulomyxa filosa]|uniref:Transmembrane protein n=1 Tax=Reticulomyxa filosa TaxID=46433 RepID=X6MS95_RETFI|nr:hypothetical protein RFI_21029 [Reticulomyxa filosa]|eukprot:ETO16322.1 hypothetical protein RFI_21029 [Reticulomyxa filosa]
MSDSKKEETEVIWWKSVMPLERINRSGKGKDEEEEIEDEEDNEKKKQSRWGERWLILMFIKLPLFFSSYAAIYQISSRLLSLSLASTASSKEQEEQSKKRQTEVILCTSAFVAGYVTQRYVIGPWHWPWILYLLLRAMRASYNYSQKEVAPKKKKHSNDSNNNNNALLFQLTALLFGALTYHYYYYSAYVPKAFRSSLEGIVTDGCVQKYAVAYDSVFHSHHKLLPKCQSYIHMDENEQSCMKSFVQDLKARFVSALKFFAIFHLLNLLYFNAFKLWSALLFAKVTPNHYDFQTLFRYFIQQTLRSTCFFVLSFHCLSRIPCALSSLLEFYQRRCLSSSARSTYTYSNSYNSPIAISLCGSLIGVICSSILSSPRRNCDILIYVLWQLLVQRIRMHFHLRTFDSDAHLHILRNPALRSFFFALVCALSTFLFLRDPSCLNRAEVVQMLFFFFVLFVVKFFLPSYFFFFFFVCEEREWVMQFLEALFGLKIKKRVGKNYVK